MPLPLNSYGNVDITGGVPPGCIHVQGLRIGPTAKRLGIEYAPALVGYQKHGGRYYPKVSGVVVGDADAPLLRTALAERDDPAKREKKARTAERSKASRQARYTTDFARRVREGFPRCPEPEVMAIARHAAEIGSGRVGRCSTAADPVRAAVAAHIRHCHTDYEKLLPRGYARDEARAAVRERVNTILAAWAPGDAPETGSGPGHADGGGSSGDARPATPPST